MHSRRSASGSVAQLADRRRGHPALEHAPFVVGQRTARQTGTAEIPFNRRLGFWLTDVAKHLVRVERPVESDSSIPAVDPHEAAVDPKVLAHEAGARTLFRQI